MRCLHRRSSHSGLQALIARRAFLKDLESCCRFRRPFAIAQGQNLAIEMFTRAYRASGLQRSQNLTAAAINVRIGSRLCENTRTLRGDRTSHSLKTVFVVKRASALNLENELKNVIQAEFRSFAFLHTQGHRLTSAGT